MQQFYNRAMVTGPQVLSSLLSTGETGIAYTESLFGTGGTPSYAWSVASGTVPPGTSLLSSGALAGTPTATGNFTFKAQFSDAHGLPSLPAAVSVSVITGVNFITASPLPTGTQGIAYSTPITVAGGLAPYQVSILSQSGSNAWAYANGFLTGSPTAAESDVVTLQAIDALGYPCVKAFTVSVIAQPNLAITNSLLPTSTLGSAYSSPLTGTGGTPAYAWLAPGGVGPGLSLSAGGIVSGTPAIPPLALAAGYTLQTFGSLATFGANWFNHNFYQPVTANAASQNADGSLLVTGAGANYGVCTAQRTSTSWTGTAFGGGALFRFVFSYLPSTDQSTGWPALWANDIETMQSNSVTSRNQWAGQATGFGNWIETDFFEADAGSLTRWGFAMHNWYGTLGSGVSLSTAFSSFAIPTATDPNVCEFLWIPATASTQGSATQYLNGTQVAQVTWAQYNPATNPPPVAGSSAYSVLDTRHMALIMGTAHNQTQPMTIYATDVWQASAAGNISQ